jgi:DNA polymerase-3 subunit delta'
MKTIAPFETWPIRNEPLRSLHERIAHGQVPHAILLVGERLATELMSEYLGKLLLCTGLSAPCGHCEACRRFAAGSHPDYMVVDGATEGIKTAQVEALQQQLMVRAHGDQMVYVLREVDLATPVAANRLLKTLEEPPAPIVAILTTAHLERVLATIRSRCFAFPAAAAEEAAHDPWPPEVTALKEDADGKLFATLLERVIQWTQAWLERKEPALLLAERLLNMAAESAETVGLSHVLWMISGWWQDLLHTKVGEGPIRFADHRETLGQQAQLATIRQLTEGIQLLLSAQTRLQAHVAPNLNAEQLCIRLRRLGS